MCNFSSLPHLQAALHSKEVTRAHILHRAAMELNRGHWRAMIFYDYKSGLRQQESLDRLQTAFGEEAPSRTTVFAWFAEFRRGRRSLEDEERCGRPVSATTEENVVAVRTMVEDDARVTVAQLVEETGISSGAIRQILHEKLGLSKISARWVPHQLTADQKKARVTWCRSMLARFDGGRSNSTWEIISGDESWVYSFDPETKQQSAQWTPVGGAPPQKFRRERSVAKQMVAVFVAKTGHVATVPLVQQRTVTGDWYANQCLPQVLDAVATRRPRTRARGSLLHHDNAPAHTSRAVVDFLAKEHIQLLGHPPYSPDLAPCDFFVFPEVKRKMRGVRFESPEAAVEAFIQHVKGVPASDWSSCFAKWFERMQLCIDFAGEYFEKM